jgi:hypothetical protein
MWDCMKCGSKFDDYRNAETHAEFHLNVISVTLDGIERHQIAAALLLGSETMAKLARSRKWAGPQHKELRATMRSNAAAYRDLSKKIRTAS